MGDECGFGCFVGLAVRGGRGAEYGWLDSCCVEDVAMIKRGLRCDDGW